MSYDAESRMVSWGDSSTTPASSVTFSYDGSGNRVTKTSGGATPAVTGTLYLATDHLGSTRLVTSGGAVVGCHDYLPFGEEIPAGGSYGRPAGSCSGATETVLKYTGQERDTETGLDHFPARYGSPPQGRFLTPDPAGNFVANVVNPQSWNLYSYVWNNPLANVDPTGGCTVVDGAYQDDGGAPCPVAPYESTTVTETAPPPVPFDDCSFCDLVFGGGFGGSSGNSSGFLSNFSIRRPGQTFRACMSANANTYSVGGSVELGVNIATGTNTSYSSNPVVGAVFGSAINSFFFGSTADAGLGMGAYAPGVVGTAMGAATTYGRRTTSIFSLNFAGKGGVPLALSQALAPGETISAAGVKSALGSAGKALSLGLSFLERISLDAAFTGAEAISCSIPQ